MYTTRPSRSDSRCALPVFSIVVNLVQDAAAPRGERAVVHPGRPAGVGRREALLAALAVLVVADHQVALHDVNLFPMVVHEGLGGERPRLDLQQPGAAALLALFVEVRGEDLLIEARRVSRRHFPAARQVDLHELEMLLGFHVASASWMSSSSIATARSPRSTSCAASARSSRKRLASTNSNSVSLTRCW